MRELVARVYCRKRHPRECADQNIILFDIIIFTLSYIPTIPVTYIPVNSGLRFAVNRNVVRRPLKLFAR